MLIEPETHEGTCRSCGAPVVWVITAKGKRMPLNPPVVTIPRLDMGVEPPWLEVDSQRTTSHFATCPQAQQWRRR